LKRAARALFSPPPIATRPRNEEDGCQVVEGLSRKAHFPPVHARLRTRIAARRRTVTRRSDGQGNRDIRFEEQDMKIVVIGGTGLGSKLRDSAA
jgi:hypothetical protein